MDRVIERCAGLDVHEKTIAACIRVPGKGKSRRRETRTFPTTTRALLQLRDWLTEERVTVVGMESTGSYWKPVYYLLEDEFECWLLNARHLKNVPGRKTDLIELLVTIPGVHARTAEVLIAETAGTLSRFPSAEHLASWAGMSPGNNESAGKHRAGTTRKGSNWLRGALTESAHAASQTKDTYLAAQFWRLTGRRGKKRAAVAVGHSILVAPYHILDRRQPYHDLGGDWFVQRYNNQTHVRRLVKQLERLGHHVTLEPIDTAA